MSAAPPLVDSAFSAIGDFGHFEEISDMRLLPLEGAVDWDAFIRWIDGYQRAWRTAGTALLAELFVPDVVYLHSPYAEPVVGLDALVRDWEAEREDPDEVFTMVTRVVAVDATAKEGPTGVARILVR